MWSKKPNHYTKPVFPSLPEPPPESSELLPDQKEMDKLASALTEAVLQLRAGDMDGARETLSNADRLCGVRISSCTIQPQDHYLDAVRYEVEQHQYQPDVPERKMTATEVLLRQRNAERQMHAIQAELLKNINTTIPSIIVDNTGTRYGAAED